MDGYRELSADEVAQALQRLPGWEGTTARLERTVTLPGADRSRALDGVSRAESELDHHAAVEESGEDVTFRVWTHSRGCVTALDVELAERIEAVLSGAGS